MILHLLIGLICLQKAYSTESQGNPPVKPPDFVLSLLKKTYGQNGPKAEKTIGVDVGEPLFLTPYIKENKIEEARKAAYVDPKPFLPGVESYAGYLTVNEEYDANLFFWYFPVAGRPVNETPWIIWLQGGPGVSSLYGLFQEIGPFHITDDGKLEEAKYSWGKNHSLLFIDNPVGTGYSFTKDERGYATNQTTIGENLYSALQQFLTVFPEMRAAPLTIAGESYAGKHIPSLGVQILWHREHDQPINLQGLAIGDGFIDPVTLMRYSYFLKEVGLVDEKAVDELQKMEEDTVQYIQNGLMDKAHESYDNLLTMIEIESHWDNVYNYIEEPNPLMWYFELFVERDEVRRAIHVGNISYNRSSELVLDKLNHDFMNSVKTWLEELLEEYQVMLYNGQLDIIVAYPLTLNTINSLNFTGSTEYQNATRLPWYIDDKLVGYFKKGGKLTEVMVRNAGHMVPTDQPAAALDLISTFARGLPPNGR